MNTRFLFLSLILGLLSCTSTNSTDPLDSDTPEQILGNWSGQNDYSIQFFADGTFKDRRTLFEYDTKNDEMVESGFVVRRGKYNLDNNILRMTEFYIDSIEMSGNMAGTSSVSTEYKIEIDENILKMTRISIFSNIEKSNNYLWGSWRQEGWQCSYSKSPKEFNIAGIWNRTFTFTEDSLRFKCEYYSDIPQYQSTPSWIKFSYNKPFLDISPFSEYNIKVDFENNQMIWTYDSTPTELVKE